MKFKVGQRVTVNVEGVVGSAYDGLWFNPEMKKYHGDTFKIESFPTHSRVKLEGNYFDWSLEWLELADGEQPDGKWCYKGKLYNVVDRLAEQGELMLVINPYKHAAEEGYGLHDVLKCSEVNAGYRYYGEGLGHQFLKKYEYKVLVPVEDEEPTHDVPVQDVEVEQDHAPVTPYGVLEAARKHMLDRAATYDSPEGERSMKATVQAFNAIHGTELTEAQGWTFMTLLKLVRTAQREAYHADSYEDAAAYVGLAAEAKAKE